MQSKLPVQPAVFLLLGATTFWGLNFHLAKIILQEVNFVEAGFWRYILGVGFLLFLVWQNKQWSSWSAIKQGRKGILLVGIIGLFGFNLLFFLGLQYTSALNAALIVALNPATTLLFSHWLLGTPIVNRQRIGMGLAFLGVLLLLTKGQPWLLLEMEWSIGDLFILGANIVFGLQNIWVKQYAGNFNNLFFTFLTSLLCLLGFALALPVLGMHTPPLHHGPFWLSMLGMGFLGTSMAYLFWNRGIQLIGAANAGLYMNAIPLMAALFALVFGAQLFWYHAYSGALILYGLYFVQRHRNR